MYRYSNGQISLSDFQQPMGMRLREDNRWVKKAQSIPWDKIEEKYADLFPSETGNVAKPLQLALGACLIQREYGYSDVETVLQIQENPYLQYFCGYAGYDDSKLPFDASSMVHFRKRLTPEVLAQINEMVIQEAQKTEDNDNQDDNKPDGGGNSGTIIVDATCAPSNIRYPQDVSLLNEARENAEKLLDILHSPTDGKKPRTYRKRARKDYLKYVRCRKHTAKMTRKAIGKQLNYLKRDLAAIDGKLNQEKALNIHQTERLETIRKIYEQQKYMYDNHTHSVENRIVSVSQPFVRPIVRGKVGKPVEFGMKLDISVTDGWTRLEYRSFDAYNEATKLQEMIENFHKREGHYPSRVLADKIYRNRENLSYCKARGIRLSGPALGRPKKGEDRNKAQDYRDECERVEVERKFSLGKRKCGMGLVTAKLEETAAHVVALSILLLNLRKIQCAFCNFWIGYSDFCNRVKNGWLFSRHYLAARLAGYQDAPRFCHTFGHSPILWQISSFEQLLSTRPIPGMLYYQQPPDPSLCRLSPTSLVLWSRLTSVGSAMPCTMGYILRCVPHRSPRIRYNSLHSM